LARRRKPKKKSSSTKKPPAQAASLLMPEQAVAKVSQHKANNGQILYHETYSGPVPHPTILAGLDKVVPGAAEKVIDQFVAQGDHRRDLESRYLKHENLRSILGVVFAGLIVLVALAIGGFLAWSGKPLIGALFSGVPLGTVVSAFIYGTKSRQRERLEKSKANPPPQ